MSDPIVPLAERSRSETSVTASGAPTVMPVQRFTPVVRHVFDYWCRRAVDRLPSRADIDPTELPLALPSLILWDVAGPCEHFTCRLAGTRICDVAGRELRGISVEEMHWDHPDAVTAEFVSVCRDRTLHYVERGARWVCEPYKRYSGLLMPLSADGRRVDMLLGVIDFRA